MHRNVAPFIYSSKFIHRGICILISLSLSLSLSLTLFFCISDLLLLRLLSLMNIYLSPPSLSLSLSLSRPFLFITYLSIYVYMYNTKLSFLSIFFILQHLLMIRPWSGYHLIMIIIPLPINQDLIRRVFLDFSCFVQFFQTTLFDVILYCSYGPDETINEIKSGPESRLKNIQDKKRRIDK